MADADRYQRLQTRLALLGFGITLGYLVLVLATGAGHATAQWAARLISARWGQVALVALALGAAHGVLSFPFRSSAATGCRVASGCCTSRFARGSPIG